MRVSASMKSVCQGVHHFTLLVLDQAKALYRYWPEVGDRLFAEH
jgi:hypothetical protein